MSGHAPSHDHEAHGRGLNARRMGRLEGWADSLTLVGIMVLGAAMALGLMTATGHVTW